MSHQTISENGMAKISAAEKFNSDAKRLAKAFISAGLKLFVIDQAKIPGLQTLVIDQFER